MDAKYSLSLTLTTRCGRIGTEVIGSGKPMSWSEDGDDETVEAVIAWHGDDGALIDSVTLDGDEWRELEDDGKTLEDVLKWVSHPDADCTLTSAVNAAREGVDPDSWTDAHEHVIELQDELARMEERQQQLVSERDAAELSRDALRDAAAAVLKVLDSRPVDGEIVCANLNMAGVLREALQAVNELSPADRGLRIRFENEVPRLLLRELSVGVIGWTLRINGRDCALADVFNDGDGPVYVCHPTDEEGRIVQGAEEFRVSFMDVHDLVIY
jgi:hypothetical protein